MRWLERIRRDDPEELARQAHRSHHARVDVIERHVGEAVEGIGLVGIHEAHSPPGQEGTIEPWILSALKAHAAEIDVAPEATTGEDAQVCALEAHHSRHVEGDEALQLAEDRVEDRLAVVAGGELDCGSHDRTEVTLHKVNMTVPRSY